jgi:hypothetical protein
LLVSSLSVSKKYVTLQFPDSIVFSIATISVAVLLLPLSSSFEEQLDDVIITDNARNQIKINVFFILFNFNE